MVVEQELAERREIRPGRILFLRKVVIGAAISDPALTIVALHGTCASESQYAPYLEAMDEPLSRIGRSVVFWLYDNVGCGSSPVMDEWDAYSNENCAMDLKAIMMSFVLQDEKSKHKPCILMGHSYSATIILEMMNRFPIQDYQVSGVIFVSSAIRSLTDKRELLMKDGGHPIMRLPVFILNCLQHSMSESFLELALYKDCDPGLRDQCRSENNNNDMAMAKATHRHHKWGTSNDLEILTGIPTLVLHGSEDGIISPACSEVLGKEIPQSEVVLIPKASHLLMLEKPHEMATSVVEYLTTQKLL